MSNDYACPECGSTHHNPEAGEFALIGLTNGRIQIDLDHPGTHALVVTAAVCANCGHVTFHEA